MQSMQSGSNVQLENQQAVTITISWTPEKIKGFDVDASAFLLSGNGKVRGDDDFVFYNQTRSSDGTVQFSGGGSRSLFDVALVRVPHEIEKISMALTIHGAATFANASNLNVQVGSQAVYVPALNGMFENALILGELYRRQGKWKFRAVGQGFSGGLKPLAEHFGIDVEEPAQPVPPPTAPPAPQKTVITPIPDLTSAPLPKKPPSKICLRKGDKPVIIEKTPSIVATVSWRSGTDYDIYALVMTKSGKEFAIATFGADGVPASMNFGNGIVRHRGDVVGGGKETSVEVIDIKPNDDIVAVVPVAYSAQSNGTGSFFRFKVSLSIDNNSGTVVTIPAENANNNDMVYTCVPGIIYNRDNGLEIEPLELYSRPSSENRPRLTMNKDNTVLVVMDKGPRNDYK